MVLGDGTVGDFGDRNPEQLNTFLDAARPKVWREPLHVREAKAIKAIADAGAKVITKKILVLVDLQGMYLRMHEWLVGQNFPIEGGLVLSRLATLQILAAVDEMTLRLIAESGGKLHDFSRLVSDLSKSNSDEPVVKPDAVYANFVPTFELFYAQVPFDDLDWHLKMAARVAGGEARNQLNLLRAGIVKLGNDFRDYNAYSDFVDKLKANPEYSRSHEGFFNFRVENYGIKFIDEKEVDVRIAIRSMEALYSREVDVLCIVSSDQDFLPVHAKAADFGVRFFQADLAKFANVSGIGRRIKELGKDYLAGRFRKDWPLKIVFEAVSISETSKALYALSKGEIDGLCRMHNSRDDRLHFGANENSDGSVSINYWRPSTSGPQV